MYFRRITALWEIVLGAEVYVKTREWVETSSQIAAAAQMDGDLGREHEDTCPVTLQT